MCGIGGVDEACRCASGMVVVVVVVITVAGTGRMSLVREKNEAEMYLQYLHHPYKYLYHRYYYNKHQKYYHQHHHQYPPTITRSIGCMVHKSLMGTYNTS